MKIARIAVYRTDPPYVDGAYRWGAGEAITIGKSTVIVIETDAGLKGFGEFRPCGDAHMDAHEDGVEAAARLLAPLLLGEDPRQVAHIERLMDSKIKGHGYAKAPFDAACWDLFGQALGQPVWMLLGGELTDGASMYRVAPQDEPAAMARRLDVLRAKGYGQFQIKVGADWASDIERIRATVPLLKSGEKAMADANQGWRVDDALRVARATRDLDYIFEQPCVTYEECQQVRRRIEMLVNATDLCNYNTRSTGVPKPETRDGRLLRQRRPRAWRRPGLWELGTARRRLRLVGELFLQDPFFQIMVRVEQHAMGDVAIFGDVDASDVPNFRRVGDGRDGALLRIQDVEPHFRTAWKDRAAPASRPEGGYGGEGQRLRRHG